LDENFAGARLRVDRDAVAAGDHPGAVDRDVARAAGYGDQAVLAGNITSAAICDVANTTADGLKGVGDLIGRDRAVVDDADRPIAPSEQQDETVAAHRNPRVDLGGNVAGGKLLDLIAR